jgi:hypothetical protein
MVTVTWNHHQFSNTKLIKMDNDFSTRITICIVLPGWLTMAGIRLLKFHTFATAPLASITFT